MQKNTPAAAQHHKQVCQKRPRAQAPSTAGSLTPVPAPPYLHTDGGHEFCRANCPNTVFDW